MNLRHFIFTNPARKICFIEDGSDISTVKNAVDEAAKAILVPNELKEKEEKNEKADISTDDPTDEDVDADDEDEDDSGLTEEEQKQAKDLFIALKDPSKGRVILQAMADEAGITKTSTTVEKKEAQKTIESILEAALGEHFPTLSKILGPALKEAVELAAENKVADLRATVAQNQQEKVLERVNSARDTALSMYENSEDPKLLTEVLSLMNQYHPAKGSDPVKYFKSMLVMAADNLDIKLIKKTAVEGKKAEVVNMDARRERNRNDARANLAAKDKTNVGKENQNSRESSQDNKPRTAKDAVDEAVRTLQGK